MKKLRIAVWHNLPSGGGKRQLYNHVQGLVERGHYVESWCPDTADQKHLPLGNLIQEHIVPLAKRKNLFQSSIRPLHVVKELLNTMEQHCKACAEEINRGDFDILYANACMYLRTSPIAKYVYLPTAIYLGEPYRCFYEAMPELPWLAPRVIPERKLSLGSIRDYFVRQMALNGIRVQARAELEYAKRFDLILVNSVYSRETVLRTYNLDSKVCYLGIDTDYYKPTGEPKENFVVGLGTIYHAKGIDRAIRALGTIDTAMRPDLIWIGNGASQHELKEYGKLADKLKVNFIPKVHIPDAEVISLLSRATAMIYTSRMEPFGLAPLEANACGTPVVGIAEGGVRETIRCGINGFLAPDDDPRELGELIGRFVHDRQLAVEMGVKAREYVLNDWNMQMCTDNIESILSTLASGKRAKKDLSDKLRLHELEPVNTMQMNIERLEIKKGNLQLKGWAFIDDGKEATGSEIYVVLKKGNDVQLMLATKMNRPDVTRHFGRDVDYDDAGFFAESNIQITEPYKIGVLIVRSQEMAFQYTQ